MSKGPNDRSGVFFEGGFNVFGGDDTFWNNITANSISALRFERSGATTFDIKNFGELELTSVTGATGSALKINALTAQATSTTAGIGALALLDDESNDLLMTVNKTVTGAGWATELKAGDENKTSNDDVGLRITHDIRTSITPPQGADILSLGYSTDTPTYVELFRFKQSGEIYLAKATSANILWDTDGGGQIGGDASSRPSSVNAATVITAGGSQLKAQQVVVGPTGGTDKTLTASQTGSNDPYIKYVNGSSKWQFSNDGTTPLDFGTSNVASWDDLYALDKTLSINNSAGLTFTQTATNPGAPGFYVRRNLGYLNTDAPIMSVYNEGDDDQPALHVQGNRWGRNTDIFRVRNETNGQYNIRAYTSSGNCRTDVAQELHLTGGSGTARVYCNQVRNKDVSNLDLIGTNHTLSIGYNGGNSIRASGTLFESAADRWDLDASAGSGACDAISAGDLNITSNGGELNLTSSAGGDIAFDARGSGVVNFNEVGDLTLDIGNSIVGAINHIYAGAYETLNDCYINDAGAATIAVNAGDVTWTHSTTYRSAFNKALTASPAGAARVLTSNISCSANLGASDILYGMISKTVGNAGDHTDSKLIAYLANGDDVAGGTSYGFYADSKCTAGVWSEASIVSVQTGLTGGASAYVGQLSSGGAGANNLIGMSMDITSNAADTGDHYAFAAYQNGDISAINEAYGFYADANWQYGLFSCSPTKVGVVPAAAPTGATYYVHEVEYISPEIGSTVADIVGVNVSFDLAEAGTDTVDYTAYNAVKDANGTSGTTYGFYVSGAFDHGLWTDSPITQVKNGIGDSFTGYSSTLTSAGSNTGNIIAVNVAIDSDALDSGVHAGFAASQTGTASGVTAYGFYADGNWDYGVASNSPALVDWTPLNSVTANPQVGIKSLINSPGFTTVGASASAFYATLKTDGSDASGTNLTGYYVALDTSGGAGSATKRGMFISSGMDSGIYTQSQIHADVDIDYSAGPGTGTQEVIYAEADCTSQNGQSYGINFVLTNSSGASPFSGVNLNGDSSANPTTGISIDSDWQYGVSSDSLIRSTQTVASGSVYAFQARAISSGLTSALSVIRGMSFSTTGHLNDTAGHMRAIEIDSFVGNGGTLTSTRAVSVGSNWDFGLRVLSPSYFQHQFSSGGGEEYVGQFVGTADSSGAAASDRDWTIMAHVENAALDNGSNRYAALRITGTDNSGGAAIWGIYFPSTDASATGEWPVDQYAIKADAGATYWFNNFGTVGGANHHEFYTQATISGANTVNCLKLTATPGSDAAGSEWNCVLAQVSNENYDDAWAFHSWGGTSTFSGALFAEDQVAVHAVADLSQIPTTASTQPSTTGLFNTKTNNTVAFSASEIRYVGLKVDHTNNGSDGAGSRAYGSYVQYNEASNNLSTFGYFADDGCEIGYYANSCDSFGLYAHDCQIISEVNGDAWTPTAGTIRSLMVAPAAGATPGIKNWGFVADYGRDSSDAAAEVYLFRANPNGTAIGTGSASVRAFTAINTCNWGVLSYAESSIFDRASSDHTAYAGPVVYMRNLNSSNTAAALQARNANTSTTGKAIEIDHGYASGPDTERTRRIMVSANTLRNRRYLPISDCYPGQNGASTPDWYFYDGTTGSSGTNGGEWRTNGNANYDRLYIPLHLPHQCALREVNVSWYPGGGVGTNPVLYLQRKGNGDVFNSWAAAATATGTPTGGYIGSTSWNVTIDNDSYQWQLCLVTTSAGTSYGRYYGIFLEYELTDLLAGMGY